jgi:AraC family transcriptional regulator of adaptative response / DNA-3-methyladenine glycosylase II
LIDDGALDRDGVELLADRLGVSARHLSRLFQQHLEASPQDVAKTRRVQRAKRLLNDTDLSIPEIAARAGFASPRRMSAAFAAIYNRPPSALRQRRRASQPHVATAVDDGARSPPH